MIFPLHLLLPAKTTQGKLYLTLAIYPEQKLKFSIKDFFGKYDKTRRKLRIWSHLQKKSLMEIFIYCIVIGDINQGKFLASFNLFQSF